MHAVLKGPDNQLCWKEVKDPICTEDGVVLEVYAAALNRADLLQRAGSYPPPPGWPEWFGLEAAGVIREVGSKVEKEGKWHVGDKAMALLGGGGQAEYVAVPAGMLMPIPKGISMIEAAGMPEVFSAAYLFLFKVGKVHEGETLLMQAGASGLASVVIPMAKAFGLRVITTVISDEMADAIAYLNADAVINTSKQSLPMFLKEELEAGRGVNIAIDCLGGKNVGECLPYLAYDARWIMIATLAGDVSDVDMKQMYLRGTTLLGTTLRRRTSEEKAELLSNMVDEIWPMVENGRIRPVVFKTFPIQEAEAAHDLMASGKSAGKIVLIVKSE